MCAQVMVFDFGTEVYSWCGKLSSMEQRKAGLKLAKMLYQSGYDYTECDINPMSPLACRLSPLVCLHSLSCHWVRVVRFFCHKRPSSWVPLENNSLVKPSLA